MLQAHTSVQDNLTAKLAHIYERAQPSTKPIIKVALGAVGRGGEGEIGQRIRDDILRIQSRNGTKV